jgi:hypothetical protein
MTTIATFTADGYNMKKVARNPSVSNIVTRNDNMGLVGRLRGVASY